jgi:hypothetical protein
VFARIDISNIFYSVSRRRVKSALDRIGIGKTDFFSKWSTLANPYVDPTFALPYGFVQSPVLASLVLATSAVGEHLRSLPGAVMVSVNVDDILLSSDDPVALQSAYEATLPVLAADGFAVSAAKLRPPAAVIDLFNCDLSRSCGTSGSRRSWRLVPRQLRRRRSWRIARRWRPEIDDRLRLPDPTHQAVASLMREAAVFEANQIAVADEAAATLDRHARFASVGCRVCRPRSDATRRDRGNHDPLALMCLPAGQVLQHVAWTRGPRELGEADGRSKFRRIGQSCGIQLGIN